MEEQIIEFETAKLAKEKGFDMGIFNYPKYSSDGLIEHINCKNCISAPTQSLLQKWLRDEHNILVEMTWHMTSTGFEFCVIDMENDPDYMDELFRSGGYSTYEEALEIGLQQALKSL